MIVAVVIPVVPVVVQREGLLKIFDGEFGKVSYFLVGTLTSGVGCLYSRGRKEYHEFGQGL